MGLTVMLTVLAGAVVILAAPPVKSLSASAAFRNEMSGDAVTSESAITGAINSSGVFDATVALPTTVGLQVTLPALIEGSRECETAALAGCNPLPQAGLLSLDSTQLRVKPILDNDPDYDDLPGGLTGMRCPDGSSSALVNHALYITGTEGHWGLNANPRYEDSEPATVVRMSRTTWVVTHDNRRGELVSFGHPNILRKSGPSIEGGTSCRSRSPSLPRTRR
jgi:hypothetical protein